MDLSVQSSQWHNASQRPNSSSYTSELDIGHMIEHLLLQRLHVLTILYYSYATGVVAESLS